MHTLGFSRLLLASEMVMLLAVGMAIVATLILPKGIFHFHEVILTTYTNGTMDFSTDATILVRSLGIVSLLTLIFGLAIGSAMSLTAFGAARAQAKRAIGYEDAVATAGFMKITSTPEGRIYQLTELGQRFLRDYAFLDRKVTTVPDVKGTATKP